MTDRPPSHQPHLWVPYPEPGCEEICSLCGVFSTSTQADEPCPETLPDMPEPPAGWEEWPTGGAGESPSLIAGDMTDWVATLWQLIFADDPAEIARLEPLAGKTQSEAVDTFIEHSVWDRDFPAFVGRKGAPGERLAALRAAYRARYR